MLFCDLQLGFLISLEISFVLRLNSSIYKDSNILLCGFRIAYYSLTFAYNYLHLLINILFHLFCVYRFALSLCSSTLHILSPAQY